MALFGAKQNNQAKTAAPKAKKATVAKEEKKAVSAETEMSMQELYAADTQEKKSGRAKKSATTRYDGAFRVLVKPLITEKATELSAHNQYAFVISRAANKIEVAKAIQAVYGVKALSVNIISMKGKAVTRGRIKGQRKDWKKAIVTLKKGESIKIYEGV
ncbi:MAG: 50S ribosomal protein L23 [Patescibacteria group bacterium]|nr:50S ribosomal protein L23 [Patescibacteria group bacterium]